ncbi:MAG TPA: hypothetical protein VF210_06780 [Pseudomonadales bacterium]
MTYLFVLNVIMLTRLGYLLRETPARPRTIALAAAVQLGALTVLEPAWPVGAMALLLIVLAAAGRVLERRGRHLAGVRGLVFVIVALAGIPLLDGVGFAGWSRSLFDAVTAGSPWTAPLTAADWQRVNAVLFGLLLLTNEVNLLIRYGFHRLNLEPKTESAAAGADASPPETDERQYNAGRVIGFLERYFIFALMLAGADYGVIAVILAAKGFARFKQLDRREFAEYILIGTLASTLAAVLVALLVRAIV